MTFPFIKKGYEYERLSLLLLLHKRKRSNSAKAQGLKAEALAHSNSNIVHVGSWLKLNDKRTQCLATLIPPIHVRIISYSYSYFYLST